MIFLDKNGKNFKTHSFIDDSMIPILSSSTRLKTCAKCQYRIYINIANDKYICDDIFDALSYTFVAPHEFLVYKFEDISLSCDDVIIKNIIE